MPRSAAPLCSNTMSTLPLVQGPQGSQIENGAVSTQTPKFSGYIFPGSGCSAPTVLRLERQERTIYTTGNRRDSSENNHGTKQGKRSRYAGFRMEDLQRDGLLVPVPNVLGLTSRHNYSLKKETEKHDEKSTVDSDNSTAHFNLQVASETQNYSPYPFCCTIPFSVICGTTHERHMSSYTGAEAWTGTAYTPAPVLTVDPRDICPADYEATMFLMPTN